MSDKEQPLSDLFAAPLVLFMPEGDVKALELRQQHLDQWASNIWVQQPNALDEALLSALRCASLQGLRITPSARADACHQRHLQPLESWPTELMQQPGVLVGIPAP